MWEEVVGASLWISVDFQSIWTDFLHVDSHSYLYNVQGISRRQVLVVVQDCAHPPYRYLRKYSHDVCIALDLYTNIISTNFAIRL